MAQRRRWGGDLLEAFLTDNAITKKDAAEALGLPASSLHYWIVGDQTPNADSAARVAKWTGGAVPADSWISEPEKFNKVKPFTPTGTE